jgi:MFS transporter, putative metabolite:H+ symporter
MEQDRTSHTEQHVSFARIGLGRPALFWAGTVTVAVGVVLHLPMFLSAASMHYQLAGMAWDPAMTVGMILVGIGLVAVVVGLVPMRALRSGSRAREDRLRVSVLEDTPLRPAHFGLVLALTFAVAIDTQKPFTFVFILPGVAREYGLDAPGHPTGGLPVALLPFFGILGTVIGSILWGCLGDRLGRRSTILLSGVVFVGTSVCGAMPSYEWNLAMCFAMGLGVGGLVPIAYSLLAEMIPARRRGPIVVLVGGVGTAAGFLLTSLAADLLIPLLSWRVMWFAGLPTGLALLALADAIPESPRFLLRQGRTVEAETVLRRFGARLVPAPSTAPSAAATPAGVSRPVAVISSGLVLCGIAWGLANFGFLVWLPIEAAKAGVEVDAVTTVLAKAAVISLPGCAAVAWLYGRWSTKATLVATAATAAASLGVFALAGTTIVRHSWLFTALVVLTLVSMWSVVAVLLPYTAEIYPTASRAFGTGLAAGATKLGGIVALAMAVFAVAPPGIRGAALLAAVPMSVAALLLVAVGIDTRGRLEDVTARLAAADA